MELFHISKLFYEKHEKQILLLYGCTQFFCSIYPNVIYNVRALWYSLHRKVSEELPPSNPMKKG